MRWLRRMVARRSAVQSVLRPWVLAGLTTFIVGAAGLGAPDADASVKLTGFAVDQSSGVTTAMAPLGTDPDQRAAADLPPHDESVGTLAGSAGVDGGAATYTVPIAVPPGRAGMQPSVSLHYSSRGGDGVMGVGWSLSAGGAIHRCPQTVEQDGNTRGVDYTNNDRLCLDGMRLVAVSGTYGFANTQYRTEIESFARITQVGGDLASNTACFRVDDKSGRVRHYGAVTQGALSAAPTGCSGTAPLTPTARVQPTGVTPTLSWALVKEEDRVGNFQHFTYTNYGDGELLLSSITYTDFGVGVGDRTVSFVYQARATAAGGATDINSSYLGGGLTMQTQALASITTKVGTSKVRVITPSYTTSSYSKRLVLAALSECAPDAAGACNATNTHPATTFTMSDGTLDFRAADLSAALHAGGGTSTSSLKQLYAFGDLNGDGTREVMLKEDDANGVSKTSLAQLTADRQAHEVVDVSTLGVTCLTGECTGDFLGQGRTSVLKGPASVTDPQMLQVGTWGLGRQDVATSTTNLLSWKLTDIPVSYVPGGNTGVFAARDFNGDGRLDISLLKPAVCAGGMSGLYVYLDSGPDANGTEKYVAPGGALVCFNFSTEVIDHIADLDGDGLPDFVLKTGALQANFSRVLFTRRSGSVLSTTAATCSSLGLIDNVSDVNDDCHWYSTGAVVQWMDVNGDGLEDFVIATGSAPTWRVRFNTGGHFGTKLDTGSDAGLQKAATDSAFRYASSLPPMDIDGDGKPELLIVSSTRDFAMRVCSFKPFAFTGAGTECPSGGAPVPMTDALTGVTELQCPAYACPEDPRGSGGNNLPIPTGNQYGNYNGNVIYRMYQKGAGDIDSSTYHLAALKFVRTGATSVTAQVIETPLISELGATPRTVEDVFGDGLADLVTPVGCTRKPQLFTANTGGTQTYPGCMIMDDATYGVASIDLYPSLTAESATAVATSGFASTYKTHVNQNYGAKPSAQARAAMAPSSAAASAGLRVANAAPPPMPVLPDMLALTRNGVGEVAAWAIVPLSMPASQDGVLLYYLPQANGYADNRHFYFTSTMPVVSGFVQSNGANDRLLGFRSAIFGYGQAMYNVQGRGFTGFRTIVTATAPALNPTDPNYNPAIDGPAWPRRLRTTTTFHQKFPLTGQVASVVVTKQDTAIKVSEQTSTYRCASRTTTNYVAPLDRTGSALCPGDLGSNATPAANTVYFPFPDTTVSIQYDPDLGTSTGDSTTVNATGSAATTTGFDIDGNLREQLTTTADQGANVDLVSASTAVHNEFAAVDANSWWLDQLTKSKTTRSVVYSGTHALPTGGGVPNADAPTQIVTTDFTWNTDRTPKTKTIQSGIANQQSTTTYCYPPTTNAILNGCPAAPVGPTSYGLPTQVVVNAPDLDAARSPTRTTAFSYTKNGSAA